LYCNNVATDGFYFTRHLVVVVVVAATAEFHDHTQKKKKIPKHSSVNINYFSVATT